MYKKVNTVIFDFKMYHSIAFKYTPLRQPSKVLMNIGFLSVAAHFMILLTMFFASGYQWISYLMLENEWFAGTVTILLLIEHSVWLHLLWCLADHAYYSLGLAYIGVLLAMTSWVMELVIPTEPDPKGLHPWFCILFIAGCVLNVSGSLLLLPGKHHGIDASYKYVFAFLALASVMTAAVWFTWWMVKDSVKLPGAWHIEETFQIVAYSTYLAAISIVFNWFRVN